MAASASLNWQKPASWFNSTPHFLAAQRSAVSSRREEVAQRKPLKGFPLDSFGNKRAAALLRSREFQICSAVPMVQFSTDFGSTHFLACKYLLVCKMTNNLFAEQQIWWHSSAARHFCFAKIRAGRAAMGKGVLIAENAAPAQRNFQRKFTLRRVGSHKFVVPLDYRAFKST